ncbi:MAG: FAD binding domain-containing protein [Treponema sp.]|nr:FAD binding domain-containing protein [Treponema sp.]
MEAPLNQVIFPSSFQELFAAWNRFPNAVPYAGGTDLIGRQEKNMIDLPPVFLCLDKIEELQRITRTEHYLEIGSMVKLNRLIRLGKIVPEILSSCLENIAGVQLRNLATIGGNICSSSRLLDLPAPLTALEAQYEFRNASNATRWVSASRFHSEEQTALDKHELLTRVRLPLHQWDYAVYKKFLAEDHLNTEALVFLAKTQKNVLSDIRVIYKSSSILRNKDAEDILIGKFLPFSRKTAEEFISNWIGFLAQKPEIKNFSKNSLISSIEENIFNLSE